MVFVFVFVFVSLKSKYSIIICKVSSLKDEIFSMELTFMRVSFYLLFLIRQFGNIEETKKKEP